MNEWISKDFPLCSLATLQQIRLHRPSIWNNSKGGAWSRDADNNWQGSNSNNRCGAAALGSEPSCDYVALSDMWHQRDSTESRPQCVRKVADRRWELAKHYGSSSLRQEYKYCREIEAKWTRVAQDRGGRNEGRVLHQQERNGKENETEASEFNQSYFTPPTHTHTWLASRICLSLFLFLSHTHHFPPPFLFLGASSLWSDAEAINITSWPSAPHKEVSRVGGGGTGETWGGTFSRAVTLLWEAGGAHIRHLGELLHFRDTLNQLKTNPPLTHTAYQTRQNRQKVVFLFSQVSSNTSTICFLGGKL